MFSLPQVILIPSSDSEESIIQPDLIEAPVFLPDVTQFMFWLQVAVVCLIVCVFYHWLLFVCFRLSLLIM